MNKYDFINTILGIIGLYLCKVLYYLVKVVFTSMEINNVCRHLSEKKKMSSSSFLCLSYPTIVEEV